MNLLVELPSSSLSYWHRRVQKDRSYTYILRGVNVHGIESPSAVITVQ